MMLTNLMNLLVSYSGFTRIAPAVTFLTTSLPVTSPCPAPPTEQLAFGVLASNVAVTVPFALFFMAVLDDAAVHVSVTPSLHLASQPTSLVPAAVVILSLVFPSTVSSAVVHGKFTALTVTGSLHSSLLLDLPAPHVTLSTTSLFPGPTLPVSVQETVIVTPTPLSVSTTLAAVVTALAAVISCHPNGPAELASVQRLFLNSLWPSAHSCHTGAAEAVAVATALIANTASMHNPSTRILRDTLVLLVFVD
jgi:hypothetical protein